MPTIAMASTICGSSIMPAAARWPAMRARRRSTCSSGASAMRSKGKGGYPAVVAAHLLPNHMNLGGLSIRAVDQPHGDITTAGLRFDAGGIDDRLFHRFRQLDRRDGDAVRRASTCGSSMRCGASRTRPIRISPRRSNGSQRLRAEAGRSSPIWTTAWTIARSAPSCPTASSPAMTGWKSSCERRRPGA